MLISDTYKAQNAHLHATIPYYGSKGNQWAAYVTQLMREDGHQTILDYGCGKGSLGRTLEEWGYGSIAEYDPAVAGKDHQPEPADLVVCTDVLEHIEPEHWDAVLADLARVTRKKLFFDVCTEPAVKTLTDGRNAHLMVHDAAWWKEQLSRYFDVTVLVDRSADARFIYGEAVPKGMLGRQPDQPRARRKLTPEMSAFFQRVREQTNLHSDAMSRIESISMFEGIEDEPADMQVVCDILDPADPMPQLRQALKLTRKVMVVRDKLGNRTEEEWKALLEGFLRVFDWTCGDETFCAIGSPSLKVGGVKVVGARPSDERWEQVKAACARVSKRITPAKAHGRKAIIACYGPSLRDTIHVLRDEIDDRSDVISVSGAHDYLIANGIAPTYHVECDPRAHKADNINCPDDRVKYLIGSGCSPVLFDKLERADVALWHIATPEHVPLFFSELKEPGNIVISGGGSVGVRAVSLMYALGYRDFSIYGMDCSFADDGQMQWAGKHAGKRQDVVKASIGGQDFYTSLVLLTYATDFLEMIQKVRIDARLFGDGLLQRMCAVHAELAARQAA